MKIPYNDILKRAEFYKEDMSQFLRDMIAIPSESCDEEKVVIRIKEEMEKVVGGNSSPSMNVGGASAVSGPEKAMSKKQNVREID